MILHPDTAFGEEKVLFTAFIRHCHSHFIRWAPGPDRSLLADILLTRLHSSAAGMVQRLPEPERTRYADRMAAYAREKQAIVRQ